MRRSHGLWLNAAFVWVGALPWLLALVGLDFSFLYHGLCHQAAARTLHFAGDPMVVCSRCAGVHLGLVLGVAAVGLGRDRGRGRVREWLLKHGRTLVLLSIALNLVDWLASVWLPLSHTTRIIAGATFGAAATSFMLASLGVTRAVAPTAATALSAPDRTPQPVV